MPNNIIKSFSKKSNKSEEEVEKLWSELKDKYGEDYQRIVGTMKKILQINENFYNFINEDRHFNEYGMDVDGQILDVSIKMGKSSLIEIQVQGKRTLSKLKSIDRLKKEFSEGEHKKLEQIWLKLSDKNSKIVQDIIDDFEFKLNKVIIDMQKEIENLG